MNPVIPALLMLAATPPSTTSTVADLQVAVYIDGSVYIFSTEGKQVIPKSLITDLSLFENVVRKDRSVQLALVGCKEAGRVVMADVQMDFSPRETPIPVSLLASEAPAPPRACDNRSDALNGVLDQLSWNKKYERHLVIVARAGWGDPLSGKRSFDDLVRDADHRGIVVHGLAQSIDNGGMRVLMKDLKTFKRHPTWPIGRAMGLRRGALWTGGSHSVSVFGEVPPNPVDPLKPRTKEECKQAYEERRRRNRSGWRTQEKKDKEWLDACQQRRQHWQKDRIAVGLHRMYGPVKIAGELDVLEQLARGMRRPHDVREEEKPSFLKQVSLEPLMDAVFDFVDARAELEVLVQLRAFRKRTEGTVLPIAGYTLGKAVLLGKQPRPSRR